MEIIINPNVAYLLIFTGVMLLLIMFNDPKYSLPKVGAMAFCILAGVARIFYPRWKSLGIPDRGPQPAAVLHCHASGATSQPIIPVHDLHADDWIGLSFRG